MTKYLSDAEIAEQFDLGYHFKHVDTIFKRVFGESCSGGAPSALKVIERELWG